MTESSRILYETVRRIAHALPNVEDSTSYGAQALKVYGKLFIRLREDLNAIVVKTTFDEREVLMAADPDVYFITDHYLSYPWILVNLDRVDESALRELIRTAYNLAKSQKKSKPAE